MQKKCLFDVQFVIKNSEIYTVYTPNAILNEYLSFLT